MKICKSEITIDTFKIIQVKDLNPKKFIELFVKRYDEKAKRNLVTLSGEFPKDWIKKEDLEYLISQINSKQKCCGYMNVFSSFLSSENAEVGGFAIIFLKSYIDKTQINLGLNSNPKVDKNETKKIMKWYNNQKNK